MRHKASSTRRKSVSFDILNFFFFPRILWCKSIAVVLPPRIIIRATRFITGQALASIFPTLLTSLEYSIVKKKTHDSYVLKNRFSKSKLSLKTVKGTRQSL